MPWWSNGTRAKESEVSLTERGDTATLDLHDRDRGHGRTTMRGDRMRKLFVMLCVIATMGLAPSAGATEVIHGEASFSVWPYPCFDERIEVTGGTATIVDNGVASVVTMGGFTAVGLDSGDRYQVSFGFRYTFPAQEFIVSSTNRLVVSDPDGNKYVGHTVTTFSWVNGGPGIETWNQMDRCIYRK